MRDRPESRQGGKRKYLEVRIGILSDTIGLFEEIAITINSSKYLKTIFVLIYFVLTYGEYACKLKLNSITCNNAA